MALQLALGHQITIALGPLHRVSQSGNATRNDRDFVDGVGVRKAVSDQRMARFMIGDSVLLLLVHHPLLFLKTGRHPLNTFVEFCNANGVFLIASRQQGGFVHQIRQVSTDESWRDR